MLLGGVMTSDSGKRGVSLRMEELERWENEVCMCT